MAIKPLQVALPRSVIGKARSQNPVLRYKPGDKIRRDNYVDPNQRIRDRRTEIDPTLRMRNLVENNGLVSTTVVSMVRMAMSGASIWAYTTGTNEFSAEGLAAAETLLSTWDTVWDYTSGYADKRSLDMLIETMMYEVAQTGGVGAELVLNAARFPDQLVVFPYDSVSWKAKSGGGGRFPSQRKEAAGGGGESQDVDLNIPTVWVSESMKSADKVYALSFLSSGFSKLDHYEEFIEDMRRVIRQAGGPRLLIKLNYQNVVASAPPDTQADPTLLAAYLDAKRQEIQDVVNTLEPEDALVFFDMVEVDTADTVGEKKDYKDLMETLSGSAASALKSNPSILGLRLGGSQNVASTESMLFMKIAEILQGPPEEVLSRALTLAVRLLGVDCYIKFKFDDIDLRPKNELEAHKSLKQARVLELLSLGFLSDEEASVMLGTGTRAPGAPPLSGTMFYEAKPPGNLPTTNQDTMGRQISPDGPTSAGGRDNQQRPG